MANEKQKLVKEASKPKKKVIPKVAPAGRGKYDTTNYDDYDDNYDGNFHSSFPCF